MTTVGLSSNLLEIFDQILKQGKKKKKGWEETKLSSWTNQIVQIESLQESTHKCLELIKVKLLDIKLV